MGNHRTLKIAIVAAVILSLSGGAAAYFVVFGGSAPSEVAFNSPGGSATFDGTFDGPWTVDTESGSFDDFTSTFAGYRVNE